MGTTWTALAIGGGAFAISTGVIHGLSYWVDSVLLKEGRRFSGEGWGRPKHPVAFVLKAAVLILVLSLCGSLFLTSSPILGLLVLISVPVSLPWLMKWYRAWRARQLETSAIGFFHALSGLLKVGVGLPTALFTLSSSVDSPFPKALGYFLKRFRAGVPLSVCLSSFRIRSGLARAALCLGMLEIAYNKGLSALPILERMLPLLEAEENGQARIRSVRNSVIVQGALAALMPWILGGFLGWVEPSVIENFLHSPSAPLIVGAAVVWESLGGYFLWRSSQYY